MILQATGSLLTDDRKKEAELERAKHTPHSKRTLVVGEHTWERYMELLDETARLQEELVVANELDAKHVAERDSLIEQLESAQDRARQFEEWLRFYAPDDVDVDYMVRNRFGASTPANSPDEFGPEDESEDYYIADEEFPEPPPAKERQ
jgi:hypothetical protein